MADSDFVSAFPPLREELERIREYEKAVAEEAARIEMLALVEHNSERAEQEAREEEDLLLFGIDFGQRSIDED